MTRAAEILRIKQACRSSPGGGSARTSSSVLKKLYNERDKRSSATWANVYVDYFIDGGYLLDIKPYHELMQGMVLQTDLQEITDGA